MRRNNLTAFKRIMKINTNDQADGASICCSEADQITDVGQQKYDQSGKEQLSCGKKESYPPAGKTKAPGRTRRHSPEAGPMNNPSEKAKDDSRLGDIFHPAASLSRQPALPARQRVRPGSARIIRPSNLLCHCEQSEAISWLNRKLLRRKFTVYEDALRLRATPSQ